MNRRVLGGVLLAAIVAACTPPAEQEGKKPANNTMVIGIDVSGSFRESRLYDDAVEFAALYIYGSSRSRRTSGPGSRRPTPTPTTTPSSSAWPGWSRSAD